MRSPSSLLRGSGPHVALVLFLGTVAAAAVSASVHPERRLPTLARVRGDVESRCRSTSTDPRVRASPACTEGADARTKPVIPIFKQAHADVEAATAAAARGDVFAARVAAARALAGAEEADRAGGLIGHVVARRVRDEVLEAVRAKRDVFDDRFVASAFGRYAPVSASAAVLEQTIAGERVGLAAVKEAPPLVRPLLAAYVPFEVARMTERREKMAARASAGDRAACVAAADRSPLLDVFVNGRGFDEMLCTHAVTIETSRRAFEAERRAAIARLAKRG